MKVLEEVRELFGMVLEHTDSIEHVKMKVRMKNGARINYAFDRKKWEKKQNKEMNSRHISDIFNAVIDIIGITASISVLTLLIVYSILKGVPEYVMSNTAYGAVLVLFFLSSTLYYFMRNTPRKFFYMLRSILQYIIVGITFIPVCFDFIGGTMGPLLYSVIVIAGIIGLFLAGRNTELSMKLAMASLVIMAWLWIPGIGAVLNNLGLFSSILLIISSILYTTWAIVSNRSPEHEDDFVAGNLFLLLSIFPVFTMYLHMLGILSL